MPNTFKRATQHSQAEKGKGNWVVSSRLRPKRTDKRCMITLIAGEIRNHIYDYVFTAVTLVKSMPSSKTRYLVNPESLPAVDCVLQPKQDQDVRIISFTEPKLGAYRRINGLRTKWHSSLNGLSLTLANKMFYNETVEFLYHSTAFYFQSPNRLDNFLSVVTAVNLAAVTRLSLQHITYGEPRLYDDNVWKRKHDEKWARTCEKAVASLLNLKKLNIVISVQDNPLRFTFNERWVQPLLLFAQLPLSDVRVALQSWNLVGLTPIVKIHSPGPKRNVVYRVEDLRNGNAAMWDIHDEFAEAIARKILGMDEDLALESYRHAVLKKWKRYREILPYCEDEFRIAEEKYVNRLE